MSLQLFLSKFTYIWGKFCFSFISVWYSSQVFVTTPVFSVWIVSSLYYLEQNSFRCRSFDHSISIDFQCYALTSQNRLVANYKEVGIGIIWEHHILCDTRRACRFSGLYVNVYIYLPGTNSYGNIDTEDSTVQSNRTATFNQVNKFANKIQFEKM
jgi:hypothetical protein